MKLRKFGTLDRWIRSQPVPEGDSSSSTIRRRLRAEMREEAEMGGYRGRKFALGIRLVERTKS